jgi:hypothetical protein
VSTTTIASRTYVQLLVARRSEVFVADLRAGDLVVVSQFDGDPAIFKVISLDPVPDMLGGGGKFIRWARLVDLNEVSSDRAAQLREQGHTAALDMSYVFGAADEFIYEIIGDVRR